MSFANATLGSRHSIMISASVNVSYFLIFIPLLFNTINIILLDLAFIYILWETISIVCFLGAIILMDCILILKGGVL